MVRAYLKETTFKNPFTQNAAPSLCNVQAECKSSFYSDVLRHNDNESKGLNLSAVRSSRASVDLS